MMARAGKDEKGEQRRIQSIEVGFQVIRVMEAAEGPLPLRDIAAAAGMPASKAHLYLASFIREGMAYQDKVTGHYGLGRFAIQLGLSAIRQIDVVEVARPELVALRDATECAAYLSLWGDRGPGIVLKVDGPRQGSLAVRLGYVLPTTPSATGRVFLAFLDPGDMGRTRPEDEDGWVSLPPDELEAALAEVREQGYAFTSNSINTGFAAVAAPVFGFDGRIAAVVTILGSHRMLAGATRKTAIAALLDTSRSVSAKLGHVADGIADDGIDLKSAKSAHRKP